MNGHNKDCSNRNGQDDCYKWFKGALDYANDSARFIVIMGVDPTTLDSDTDSISVRDQNDIIIDGFSLNDFGVAASEVTLGLPRRMLVPPYGDIQGTDSIVLSLVSCCCLEKALAIL